MKSYSAFLLLLLLVQLYSITADAAAALNHVEESNQHASYMSDGMPQLPGLRGEMIPEDIEDLDSYTDESVLAHHQQQHVDNEATDSIQAESQQAMESQTDGVPRRQGMRGEVMQYLD